MRKLTVGLLVAVVVVVAAAAPAHALECEGSELDDGCLFTITGGATSNPIDGYAVTNAAGVPLWDFVRDREAQAIGYPISQRWSEGPFTLQAFQKVILQWDPGRQRMNYYNTLDALANRYPWVELPFVPPHQVLEEDQGATLGAIIRNHLALLDQNEAIKERFLREPDWLNLYGLPIRYEERAVDVHPAGVQLLRTQRTVFVVWNVPAPGVTVGRVNLQNVPDKLKQLSNVVIPDAAKALARAPGPALDPSIRVLPWVADGITEAEEATVLLLRKISSSSPNLFRTLLLESRPPWLGRPPTPTTEAALNILLGIADVSWTRKELVSGEPGMLELLVHVPEDRWPSAFQKLLLKPWLRDGVTWNELQLIDSVLYFLIVVPRQPGHYFGRHDTVNQIFSTMLDMPFLDTFEGYETYLMRRLPSSAGASGPPGGKPRSAGGPEYALQVLASASQSGGITDEQALAFMIDRPSPLDVTPDQVIDTLNRTYQNVRVEQRVYFHFQSGYVRLIVVRDRQQPIPPDLLDTLNHMLVAVVEFTGAPFPNDHLVVQIQPGSPDRERLGRHGFYETLIAGAYIGPYPLPHDIQRALVHLFAHYYWENNAGWLDEGAATLYEYGLNYRGPDWPPAEGLPEDPHGLLTCPDDSVHTIDESGFLECRQYLGIRLFLDLYRQLDEVTFRSGFARLFNMTYGNLQSYCIRQKDMGLDAPCIRSQRTPYVDLVTEAFTSGASPEAAATARFVIGRWYYGDPGALSPS